MSLLSRLLCAAVLAAFFFSLSRANAQSEFNYDPACLLTTSGCSQWNTYTVTVFLPEYPGCEIGFKYRERKCPDPASPLPISEIIVESIFWETPDSLQDSTHPCFNIHDAYITTPTPIQGDFLKHLFQETITTRFGSDFDQAYVIDSVQALIFPDKPEEVQEYTFRLCGFGKKTYRVINGLCMAALTKPDVPFSGVFNRAEDGGEKGSSIASGPPHSATNYMRVRYVPCGDISQVPCCVQLIQFCRDNLAGKTEMQIIGTIIGPTLQCPLSFPKADLEPGETTTGCQDYCLDYGPGYGTEKSGEGDGPRLSGPVEGETILRLEGVRNGDAGRTNR